VIWTAMALPFASFVVQYSRCGREQRFSGQGSLRFRSGLADGPEEAVEIRKALADATGLAASAIGLNVLPRQAGGPQSAVKPVAGQSLLSFLEQCCREDHGVFQLRASFDHPSNVDFVQVRVACPGTATSKAAANSTETQPPPIVIEQFELEASSTVAALKKLIHERSKYPVEQMVLLLGCRRLQDELPMGRVSAAAEASNVLLQLHLAARGAMAFLRREGQGHRDMEAGDERPETLKLILPRCIPGRRERPMPINLEQSTVSDLRWSVQSICGLSPARMRLLKDGEIDLSTADESSTLNSLGFTDGSTLLVDSDTLIHRDVDMPVDLPSTGPATWVYDTAATMLGLPDSSKLSLFAGPELINRHADLSQAPIADGVILSAYISWPLQLPVFVLQSGIPSPVPGDPLDLPGHVAVRSCDTVAEVRQRLLSASSSELRNEVETLLDGSLAFAVESSLWQQEGRDCHTLASLEVLLGHFTPCPETARISRLGMADGGCHMVFVTRRILSVEVQVHQGEDWKGVCQLRVPSTIRLSELSSILIRSLSNHSELAEVAPSEFAQCSWRPYSEELPRSSSSSSFTGGVAAVISKVKRKSLGGSPETPEKRRRLSYSKVQDLDDTMFLGDLLAQHPVPQSSYQQFLCPISMDIMQDPVVVGGSGNTYDRKSIEKHFQHCQRDPLNNMELRRPADRKLIPNNQLRSQIREAEISRVQLRLSAHLTEQRSFSSDAPMAAYLGWCASLLRGT